MIPTVNNLEQLRKALNALMEDPQKLAAGYGPGLPAAVNEPEGRYFVNTTEQQLYQVQSGAWVLVETNMKSLVEAIASGSHSATNGATVLYPSESFDLLSEYDASTSVFTAAVDGYYRIYASIKASSLAAGKYIALQIDRSGSTVAVGPQSFNDGAGAREAGCAVTDVVAVAAGQTLKIQLVTDTGGSVAIVDGTVSHMNIQRI